MQEEELTFEELLEKAKQHPGVEAMQKIQQHYIKHASIHRSIYRLKRSKLSISNSTTD